MFPYRSLRYGRGVLGSVTGPSQRGGAIDHYPVEVGKGKPGTHTMGRAVDIVCRGEKALDVLRFALQLGFTGIGVKQHGKEGRFLHLDDLTSDSYHGPRPTVWSY